VAADKATSARRVNIIPSLGPTRDSGAGNISLFRFISACFRGSQDIEPRVSVAAGAVNQDSELGRG
jgi:hypothetical protein